MSWLEGWVRIECITLNDTLIDLRWRHVAWVKVSGCCMSEVDLTSVHCVELIWWVHVAELIWLECEVCWIDMSWVKLNYCTMRWDWVGAHEWIRMDALRTWDRCTKVVCGQWWWLYWLRRLWWERAAEVMAGIEAVMVREVIGVGHCCVGSVIIKWNHSWKVNKRTMCN